MSRRTATIRSIRVRTILAATDWLETERAEMTSRAKSIVPDELGRPFAINLTGPHASRDPLKQWGIPDGLHDLGLLVHQRDGGLGTFRLPEMPAVYVFVAKAARHKMAHPYLVTLARVAVYSQLTLSEAASLTANCMRASLPHVPHMPGALLRDWQETALMIINAWQARDGRDGVGDPVRVAEGLRDIRDVIREHQLARAEAEVAAMRAKWGVPS